MYEAYLHVASEHGRPRIGQFRYRLRSGSAEGLLCACAWGSHLTADLPGFYAAIRRSGIAVRHANMIELVSEHGPSVVAGDSISLDGEAHFAWERAASEAPDAYHFGGSPRGRASILTDDVIVLAAQAARVASTMASTAPRTVAEIIERAA